ncbi:MAG: hypothetical protein KKF00_10680 [Proteobacteria bacterium]|nr:hypothetical protein [Pseudomonadota bacterium]
MPPLSKGMPVFKKIRHTQIYCRDTYDPKDRRQQSLPFECSLCGLCGAVCPVDLDPKTMFLEMRREAVRKGVAPFPEHKALINYEKRATSKQYSYYALPDGCDTIFSPGCNIFEK